MRAALGGLTLRGRCLGAAGVALCALSIGLGQRDLLRVGCFLLALPLVAVAVVSRTRYRLALTRGVTPARTPVGQPATVTLRLDNVSRLPSGVLLLEDAVPYALGTRPRFVLDKVEPQGVREVTYPVRSDVRGRFRVGPLAVRLADPFGLCELPRSFSATDDVVVTPQVMSLPSVRLGGDWTGGGEAAARAAASAGEDDAATREYRTGDDLRKVHWRSTARAGELMVRREEQPWQNRAALLLDDRAGAHVGDGAGSSFEWAVAAAASVAVHLCRAGYQLRLVVGDGPDLAVGPAGDGAVLDRLAVVGHSVAPTLAEPAQRVRRGGEGLLVAVLGALDPVDVQALARVRAGGTAAVAVLLDAAGWVAQPPRVAAAARAAYDASAGRLEAAGWRVLRVGHGTTLASVWPQAGAGAVRPLVAGGAR